MIRLVLLVGALLIFLFASGGHDIYTAAVDKQPVTLTLHDFIAKKPESHWLVLKDCTLDYTEASTKKSKGRITEVYVPVTDPKGPKEQKVHVLLSMESARDIAVVEAMEGFKTEDDVVKYNKAHPNTLIQTRDVEGLVEYGVDLNESTRKELADLNKNTDPDFILLRDGQRPDMGTGIAKVLGGFALLGVTIFFVLRRRR